MRRAPNPWDRFYHAHQAPWRGERPLADLRPWLGGRVLELGCGNGKLLRPLQAAGIDAVGLDVSFNVLQRLGQGVLADAAALPLSDGAFDTVLDVHCTGHLLEAGRAAAHREQRRVLRPGGHVVIERLHPDDLRAAQGEALEGGATRRLQDGRTTHMDDEASLATALESAGFHVIHRVTHRRTQRLPSGPVVRASVRVVGVAD